MTALPALVPMPALSEIEGRRHSQRVPGQKYRLLTGQPLYRNIFETICFHSVLDGEGLPDAR